MNLNPFIITGKIIPQYFCDRVEETKNLIDLIKNRVNVALVSPRGMGKSGLIRYCFDKNEIGENHYAFFIDILPTSGFKEFVFILAKEIYDTLYPGAAAMAECFLQLLRSINGKFTYHPSGKADSFDFSIGEINHPEFTLKEIFSFLEKADKRCLVAIDEFQQVARYPENNVEALIKAQIQNCGNCNFILAGSRKRLLQEMISFESGQSCHGSSVMELHPIPKNIYSDFVTRIFNTYNKTIERRDIEKVYDLFEGNTFYLQRIFNKAFDITKERENCTYAMLDDVLDYVVNVNGSFYRELLSNIPEYQKEVLFAVATNKIISRPTSALFIKSNGLKSASSVQGALRKLIDLDLITKQNQDYFLSDKFLMLWICRTYSDKIHL